MVEHPAEYRWSSYTKNAQGDDNELIKHHPVYDSLGKDSDERCYAYRELFRHHIVNEQIHEIRDALNQELVLGHDGLWRVANLYPSRTWFKIITTRPGGDWIKVSYSFCNTLAAPECPFCAAFSYQIFAWFKSRFVPIPL